MPIPTNPPPSVPTPVLPPTAPQPTTPPTAPPALPPRVATGASRVLPAGTPTPGTPDTETPDRAPLVPPAPPGPPTDDAGVDEPSSFFSVFRRPVVLIAFGILAVAALGSLVYYLFFRPEPITLEARLIVIPLPAPTIDMITVENPTDFTAGLPLATLTYGLTAIEEMPSTAHATWPERFAEGWTLTYCDGSDSVMTVSAIQHYHEEDATAAFEALWSQAEAEAQATAVQASPSPSPSASPAPLVERLPVMAGDVQVGESFRITTEITETIEGEEGTEPTEVTREVVAITWRNTTGVFIMVADPAVIDDLFLEYGL